MARQAERREATRAALIAAATTSFVEQGYETTSTDAVISRSGVSKGALYHHFPSKAALLAAVFETVAQQTMSRAEAASRGASTPREALLSALRAWLREALEPVPRRILLEIGPAALGHAIARELEDQIVHQPICRSIARIVEHEEGTSCGDLDIAARLLNTTLAELALIAVHRGLDPAELGPMDEIVGRVLEALVPSCASFDTTSGAQRGV